MVSLKWFRRIAKQIPGPKTVRYVSLITMGLFIIFWIIEGGLNLWIRWGIRSRLAADTKEGKQIESRISWIGLGDFFAGRVNRIWINSRNCVLNDLRYSKLIFDSQGFRFNLALFLKENRFEILEMEKTRIDGVITELALNDYLAQRYPEYQSQVKIKSGGLVLSGSAQVFNKNIPVLLEGNLRIISEKKLRFYPTRLLIANSSISGSLLRLVSEQVPLEFGVMEDWPLEIRDFKLEDRKIEVKMEEIKT